MEDWNKEAKRLLKYELRIRDVSYKQLIKQLAAIGVEETERSIASKISRGTFSATFLLQCLRALNVKTVDVSGELFSTAKD